MSLGWAHIVLDGACAIFGCLELPDLILASCSSFNCLSLSISLWAGHSQSRSRVQGKVWQRSEEIQLCPEEADDGSFHLYICNQHAHPHTLTPSHTHTDLHNVHRCHCRCMHTLVYGIHVNTTVEPVELAYSSRAMKMDMKHFQDTYVYSAVFRNFFQSVEG